MHIFGACFCNAHRLPLARSPDGDAVFNLVVEGGPQMLGCSASASSEHLYDCPSSPSVHLLRYCCRLPPD